jgi:hypothetical protein
MAGVFEGGWHIFKFLAIIALSPLPMILTMDSTGWRTPPPIVPLAMALVSAYVSTWVYQHFFSFQFFYLHWPLFYFRIEVLWPR